MILKILVQFLCALILIEARSFPIRSPDKSISDKTWYKEEAILKVLDGILIVELLHNNSAPLSLNADGKGIVELNRGDFARISSLEHLSLEDNFIERIDGPVFEDLPGLVYLSLAGNRIEYLEEDSFQGLSNLEILNLNHNSLRTLSDSINDNILVSLKQLYLQHNQLTYINEREIKLCHSRLEQLYLTNNSIIRFSEGNPLCLNNLTHLYLEDNLISVVFHSGKMPIEVLSLDGNLIDYITEINPKMKFLSLARNKITYIRNYVFANAQDLVTLVLSYNKLDFFSNELFQSLPSLEHLILDHNSLTAGSMPLDLWNNLTSLRSLDLTGNRINTRDSLKQFAHLPNLEKLYLGNNHLNSFPGNESFAKSKLNYLDLSNNNVSQISRLQLDMIPGLKVLKLTGNPLRRFATYSVPYNLTILF